MPSSKGKPTDPKLREELKEKIKNQPNSDGQGKGQWSAWKAAQLSKEYEKHGGGYENEAGSKNEPKKGTPEPKSEAQQDQELKSGAKPAQSAKARPSASEKSKTSSAKKAGAKGGASKTSASKKSKQPREGTRRSSRVSAKRKADDSAAEGANGTSKKSKSSK